MHNARTLYIIEMQYLIRCRYELLFRKIEQKCSQNKNKCIKKYNTSWDKVHYLSGKRVLQFLRKLLRKKNVGYGQLLLRERQKRDHGKDTAATQKTH